MRMRNLQQRSILILCSWLTLGACAEEPAANMTPGIQTETDNDPIYGDGDAGGYTPPPPFVETPVEEVPVDSDSGTEFPPDTSEDPAPDAGGVTDPLGDLGGLLGDLLGGGGTTAPKPDAGSGPGVCEGKTPHGCYSLAPNSDPGCPAQIPEIPTLIPGLAEWDFCSGGAVGAGVTCSYNGPLGASGACICDLQAHWICVYL